MHDYRAGAALLKRYLPDYNKSELKFADFAGGVIHAIERARDLAEFKNPSTGMWQLASRMYNQEAQ